MPSLRRFTVVLVVCAMANTAWSQQTRYAVPAATVEEQFSAYQQRLSDAADALLATTVRGGSSDANFATAATGATPAEEQALQRFARQYWNGEEHNVRRAMERVAQLRPMLEFILAEEGVPKDLVAIALVESGGRITALSPKGARGVWQFMPDTARQYGLAVSGLRDERLDVAKSTRAAARYLRELYDQFGNWQLAFAAYNAGGQAVSQAVVRAGDKTFSRVQPWLPRETRNYVPAVMEAMALFANKPALVSQAGESIRSGKAQLVYAPGW